MRCEERRRKERRGFLSPRSVSILLLPPALWKWNCPPSSSSSSRTRLFALTLFSLFPLVSSSSSSFLSPCQRPAKNENMRFATVFCAKLFFPNRWRLPFHFLLAPFSTYSFAAIAFSCILLSQFCFVPKRRPHKEDSFLSSCFRDLQTRAINQTAFGTVVWHDVNHVQRKKILTFIVTCPVKRI